MKLFGAIDRGVDTCRGIGVAEGTEGDDVEEEGRCERTDDDEEIIWGNMQERKDPKI